MILGRRIQQQQPTMSQVYLNHKGLPVEEPSDEQAERILTSKAGTLERDEFLYDYSQYLKSIGYYTEEPATEWLGHRYVELILSGTIPSSDSVKKACERFKWELENQGTIKFPYIWDEDEAMSFVYFAESVFTVTNKENEKKPLVLQPNQHFRLCQEFGWKKMAVGNKDGGPRFDTYFDLMGRGSGKTTEKVPIFIYKMLKGVQVPMQMQYLAGSEELSKATFAKIREIVADMGQGLQDEFQIIQDEIRLYKPQTPVEHKRGKKRELHGSTIRRTSQSANSNHGGATAYALFDEVHTYKSREIINTIRQSFGKREGSMASFTSTRSAGISETLESLIDEGMDILDGYKTNSAYESSFYFMAYISEIDLLSNFKNWIVANPNIMFLDSVKYIKQYIIYEKDRTNVDALDFFTQQFNFIDTTAATSFITVRDLKLNSKETNLTWYEGKDAYLGVDLGGDDDFSYVIAMIPEVSKGAQEDGQEGVNVKRLVVEGRGFITESNYFNKTVINPRNFEDLKSWVDDGYIEIMPDGARNEEQVYAYMQYLMSKYKVKKIGADARDFQYIKLRLAEERKAHLVEIVDQKASVLDSPLRGLRDVFKQGNVIYNGDPFLAYCFRNAQLLRGGRVNGDGLWTLSKPRTSKMATNRAKIDGLAALADAFAVFQWDDGFAGQILKGGATNIESLTPTYKIFKQNSRHKRGGGKMW